MIIFSNDPKFYSWYEKGKRNELFISTKRNNYHKITIYAVITSKADLFYFITTTNFN